MGQSFFHFRQFSIFSQTKGLKVTTDACILGALAAHPSPSRCLDIGTGTGVLSLMLAQRFPAAQVTALEIDSGIAEEALHNISASVFGKRIGLVNADFTVWEHPGIFDLIVCNPPFFIDHLQGSESRKNRAMHNTSLPFDILAERISTFLAPGGLCWMICPEPAMSKLKIACENSGLYVQRSIGIFNKPGKYFRTICCFSAEQKVPAADDTLLLYDSDDKKTDAFKTLMVDFYLENTEIYKRNHKG